MVILASFGIAFLWDWNENSPSSPVATAEFSKFAGMLSAALSQHHLLGFEIAPKYRLVLEIPGIEPRASYMQNMQSKSKEPAHECWLVTDTRNSQGFIYLCMSLLPQRGLEVGWPELVC